MINPSLIGLSTGGALSGGVSWLFIHRKVVDNFLRWNVVSTTLTSHNGVMSNTATIQPASTGKFTYIDYANGECAIVGKAYIMSFPTNSTAIAEWTYRPAEQHLVVAYKNSPTVYIYEGVPMSVIFAMLTADSLGAFIAREVKPNYGVKA